MCLVQTILRVRICDLTYLRSQNQVQVGKPHCTMYTVQGATNCSSVGKQLILPPHRLFFMKQEQAVRSQDMPHIHVAGCLPFFRRRRRGLNSSGSESTPPSNSQVDPFFGYHHVLGLT